MKTTVITLFAAASTLCAAETNSPSPMLLTNSAPALQIPIVEQAELVRQIGEEAAKDFDSVEHARSLRAQIEALLTRPGAANPGVNAEVVDDNTAPATDPATKSPAILAPAATATTPTTSTTGPDPQALREAITILRREADRLEAQFHKLSRKP